MNSDTAQFAKLNIALATLKKSYAEDHIFGIFLYGQEQNIAAVIVPTFEDVCLNKELVHTYIDNIKVIDVRYVYHATRDGFPEIMESLYTEYYIVNPRYEHIYLKLFRANREKFKIGVEMQSPAEELKYAIMKVMRAVFSDNSKVITFLKQLTDAEKTAVEQIVAAVGDEGIFSQSKIASAAGISRNRVTSLILKMQLAEVAKIEYLGNKGTYIKILDDTLLLIRG